MGRRRHILSDGRRVIGYRKTLAQRATRTPAHLLPDWELSFELPGTLGLGLERHPLIGVTVTEGHVEAKGKNRQWVHDQALALIRKVAPRGLPRPIKVREQRGLEAPPSQSGPSRPGVDRITQIDFDGCTGCVATPTSMRFLGAA